MDKRLVGTLRHANFALIDFEGIQTSKTHCCVRSMSILSRDGDQQDAEFIPCVHLGELEHKYQKAFYYCRKKNHQLSYFPRNCPNRCKDVYEIVWKFAINNEIEIFAYKGGALERRICEAIGIDCFNIERVGAPKADSHAPREEVRIHYQWLKSLKIP